MKKVFIVLFFIILFIIMFLFIYEIRSEQEHFSSTYSLNDKEKETIRDGDIILRHGFGLVSDMIVEKLDEEFDVSHCAIINKKENDDIRVIHTVSQSLSDYDGVQEQSLDRFMKDSQINTVMVVRFIAPKNEFNSSISNRAKFYLKERIPFDHSFDIEDSVEFYCSELIWKVILDEYNIDIFAGKNNQQKDHVKFDTFWDENYFKVIINHHLKD